MRKLFPILLIVIVAMYFLKSGSCSNPSTGTNDTNSATTPQQEPSSTAPDATTTLAQPTESANPDKQTFAVIVGVSDYLNMQPGQGDLNVPTVDAKRINEFLRSSGGGSVPAQNIVLLLNNQATKRNIVSAMNQLYTQAGPEDRVIFFFAGHGDKGFFLPYEYNGNPRAALLHDEVKAMFKRSAAKTKLCIADACHSGSIKNPKLASRETPTQTKADTGSTNYRQLEDGGGVVIMMAAKSNEVSWETSEIGQGVFSFFLVRGLGGQADKNQDRVVTIEELYFYVRNNVRQYVYNKCRDANGRPAIQTPICFGKFDRNMPVGLVY